MARSTSKAGHACSTSTWRTAPTASSSAARPGSRRRCATRSCASLRSAHARRRALVDTCVKDFVVLSGDDASARDSIAAGARGVISVTANVAPRAMSEMVAAALAGDHSRAQQLDARLSALHRELFVEANPIPAKWALAQMGLIAAGIRLPLTPLSAQYQATVRAAARAAGALP